MLLKEYLKYTQTGKSILVRTVFYGYLVLFFTLIGLILTGIYKKESDLARLEKTRARCLELNPKSERICNAISKHK